MNGRFLQMDLPALIPVVNTSDAVYRPMGLAVGPDGSLYVSDSKKW